MTAESMAAVHELTRLVAETAPQWCQWGGHLTACGEPAKGRSGLCVEHLAAERLILRNERRAFGTVA